MDFLVTLFYILFAVCVVYPPTEFVSAGFTIAQIFENDLGSENVNFVGYHLKRITLTMLVHSFLPLGYVLCLWGSGVYERWLYCTGLLTAVIPLLVGIKLVNWWENGKIKHPVVRALLPYVPEGSDWRVVAANLNVEFKNVDKVSVPLTATSKFVATATWLIKITQYNVNIVKQMDCALVATSTDVHDLSLSGEDEVQYLNIEVIPSRQDVPSFKFRISSVALRDLQPRLVDPVRIPEHLSLQPTLVERFVSVFRQNIDENPVYYVNEEPELCIGCMQVQADVKLNRLCTPGIVDTQFPPCQPCNCRVLWCGGCMARWWATRASVPPARWLGARCTCPVCRAPFCIRDVSPVRISRID